LNSVIAVVLVLVCSETSVWVPTAAGKVENHDDVAKKKDEKLLPTTIVEMVETPGGCTEKRNDI
jgi:hypothetical protein